MSSKMTIGLMLCVLGVSGQDAAPALRGSDRQLQAQNDDELVSPTCLPGYLDVTLGSAYHWSCAFHCEGGKYFAQADCKCACLTQAQIDAAGIIVGQAPPPRVTTSLGQGQILVTDKPSATTVESVPVSKIPVGELGSGEDDGPNVDNGGYILDNSDQRNQGDSPDGGVPALDLTLVVTIAASTLCLLAVAMLGCAFWTGMLQRKPSSRHDLKFVEAPAIALHGVENNCPQPGQDINNSSRASSRTSCGSHSSQVSNRNVQDRSASRRSSASVYSTQVAPGGPFYDPQEIQGRSSSRRSSAATVSNQVGGPFYNPQALQPDARSNRRHSHGDSQSQWAHKVPSNGDDDGRGLMMKSSKLSVQSGCGHRRPSNTSQGHADDSPQRSHGSKLSQVQPDSHLRTSGHDPSNRRPSHSPGHDASKASAGTAHSGSRRGSKGSQTSSKTSANQAVKA